MRHFNKKAIFFIVGLLAVCMVFDYCVGNGADAFTLTATAGFAALDWPIGQNNMGGFKNKLLFIPQTCVESVPTLPASPSSNTEMVTAAGAFTFKTGATPNKPIYLYSTDGMVGYSAEPQGEKDGISFLLTLLFFFPGNLPEMHAFNALVKNTPGYFIIEDIDGNQIMVGMDGLPASASPSFAGGQAHADRRGTTYTVTADSNYSAVFLGTPIDMDAVAAGGTGYSG